MYFYIIISACFLQILVRQKSEKMIKDTYVLRAVLVTIDLSSEMSSRNKIIIIIIKFVANEWLFWEYQSIKVFKNFIIFLFLFICL